MQRTLRYAMLMSAVLLFLAGCKGGGSSPSLSGSVTFDGSPLADAEVAFEPFDKDKRIGGCVARTGADGTFKVDSTNQIGIKPGKFAVFVSKWVDRKTKKAPPAEEMEMQKSAGILINAVPPKYSDREQTPLLTADIKAGSNSGLTFALSSK